MPGADMVYFCKGSEVRADVTIASRLMTAREKNMIVKST